MRLFLVDDSPKLVSSLTDVLRDISGVRICGTARSVSSALEGIANAHPDCIILDLNIQGGSGLDVLQAVKQGPAPPSVILFSAHIQPGYRQHYVDAGADHVLNKSDDQEALIDIIRRLQARQQPD